MRDFKFGSLNKRHLHLRTYTPIELCRWNVAKQTFRFSPLRLLSWRAWKSLIAAHRLRTMNEISVRRNLGLTCRCYCPDGSSIDCRFVLLGFGLLVWYSRYNGEIPCSCDRVIAELDAESETP